MITKIRKDGKSYLVVNPDILIIGTHLPFDVFVKTENTIKPLFKKGTRLAPTTKMILQKKGISEVYIDPAHSAALLLYMRNESEDILPDFDPREFLRYSTKKEEHHQIERKLLIPGERITFSLYLLNGISTTPLIEATAISPAMINQGITRAEGDIMIKKSDLPLYLEFVDDLLRSGPLSGTGADTMREVALKEKSKAVMRGIIDDPRSGERIKEAIGLVGSITDCILNRRNALYNLLSIEQYDYYTYTHSVNVGVLSIGLGIEVGLEKEEVQYLGIGSLLHDVGKSTVPHEILNKEGKLSDIEYQIMQTHVVEAQKILTAQEEFPTKSLTAVVEHHERLSGKGYPSGLTADRISLFGRITAITDCYDALTTQRPYRAAFTPFYALSVLVDEIDDYDAELLQKFVIMLGKV